MVTRRHRLCLLLWATTWTYFLPHTTNYEIQRNLTTFLRRRLSSLLHCIAPRRFHFGSCYRHLVHYQKVALAISREWPNEQDLYTVHTARGQVHLRQVHYRDNFPGAGVDGSDDWFMCVARGHARQCRAAGRDYDVCSCCWLCVRMASPSTYAANTDPECINVSGWELLSLLDEIL